MCSHICSTCWWGQVRATTIMMQRCRIAAGTSSLPVSSTGGHCVCVHRYYIHLLLPSYNNRSVERRWSWVSVQLELTWCSRFRLVSALFTPGTDMVSGVWAAEATAVLHFNENQCADNNNLQQPDQPLNKQNNNLQTIRITTRSTSEQSE